MTLSIWREAIALVRRLQSKADDKGEILIDCRAEMTFFALNVMSVAAFGGDQQEAIMKYTASSQLVKDVKALFDLAMNRSLFPCPTFLWKLSPYYSRFELPALEGQKRIFAVCQMIIDGFKEKQVAGLPAAHPRQMKSLIEILLPNSTEKEASSEQLSKLSEEDILKNVVGFFLAGSDTTAVALSWTIYFLCRNPSILTSLRKELDAFFTTVEAAESQGNEENLSAAITDSISNSLPYCRATIRETLRLRGPAPFLFMQNASSDPSVDVTLLNGVKVMPKDLLLIDLEAWMSDPNIFDDPTSFRPDRWLQSGQCALNRPPGIISY